MKLATAAAFLALASAGPALAADPEACQTIRLSDPGWTDITSTNALAGVVLTALGYEPEVEHALGPGRLRGPEVRRRRRLPRQLDAVARRLPRGTRRRRRRRGAGEEPDRRQVHPGGAGLRRRGRRQRLRRPRPERRQVRLDDLRHRVRRRRQHQHPEDDRRRRVRPRRLDPGRDRRAGDAGAGGARRALRGLDRVPRLGAAPDEHRVRHHLPRRRRRLLRPELRRRRGLHPRPHRLGGRVPERRAALPQPRVLDRDGERDDGPDPRRRGAGRRRPRPG